MKTIHVLITATTFCLTVTLGKADILPYTIPATSDIFDAGRSAPISPTPGPGTLPVQITFNPVQNSGFQFAYLSGTVSEYDGSYVGPEGYTQYVNRVNAYDGISGFTADTQFPLVGVFLTDATPQSPSPATLDFTSAGIGLNFLSLTPGIGQVFYIGDGLTDSSQIQTFNAPAGATRLFLGFTDAPEGGGDPGTYDDNSGALNIQVTALPVPEPNIFGLLGMNFLFLGGYWAVKRNRQSRLPLYN